MEISVLLYKVYYLLQRESVKVWREKKRQGTFVSRTSDNSRQPFVINVRVYFLKYAGFMCYHHFVLS